MLIDVLSIMVIYLISISFQLAVLKLLIHSPRMSPAQFDNTRCNMAQNPAIHFISIAYQGREHRNHQSSAILSLCVENLPECQILHTKGQYYSNHPQSVSTSWYFQSPTTHLVVFTWHNKNAFPGTYHLHGNQFIIPLLSLSTDILLHGNTNFFPGILEV